NYGDLNIVFYNDSLGNVGPAISFMQLLRNIEANIYFFCDQDDYWLEFKIERAVRYVFEFTESYNKPYLYHSDLELVDSNLNGFGVTFHKNNKVCPARIVNSEILLIQNCVVGCTTAFNRLLR